jgi:hypothetical protein
VNFDDTARFCGPGEKLWPCLFGAPGKVATRLCRDCRKAAVEGIRRYCARCALKHKLASTRSSKRAKRGLNGRKTENSPIGAEALTHAEIQIRYVGHSRRGNERGKAGLNDPGAVYPATNSRSSVVACSSSAADLGVLGPRGPEAVH